MNAGAGFYLLFNRKLFNHSMRLIVTLFTFIISTHIYAQTQDLIALAEGEFLGMNALFDEKENLFGYISIYDHGKSGAKTKKFEYVVLDKNLNPTANNTFDGDITAGNYTGFINFNGKIILRPSRLDISLIKQDELFTPSSMIIDLKENVITKKVFYDFDHGIFKEVLQHNSWKENRKEHKEEKKQQGFNYTSFVLEIKEGGFLVLEYDDYGAYAKNNRIMRYDENKQKLWQYDYNSNGSKTETQVLNLLDKDENYFYALLREKTKKSDKFYLLVVDMKNGKELHRKEIVDPKKALPHIMSFQTYSYGTLDNDKTFDDKIVLLGRIGYGFNYYSGFSRLVIDKKTFDAEVKTISYKDDFKSHVPRISEYGYVEKGFFLDPRDIFILKDGSTGILFEKFKAAGEYNAQKTTDMVYVYMDKDFKVTGAKILEKEKSKWQNADYLFSQPLNSGNDLVFFYRDFQKNDETKDRNWNLFINTLIDGKFNQEMIPISSKDNFLIFPYIAKEGYILLQEFNKKAKYNQIRLERLNY